MIHLTPAAATELKRLQSRYPQSTPWVRFEVQTGGCADLSYEIRFDSEKHETDQEYAYEAIAIIVDPTQLTYLDHLKVDYSDDLMGGGFRFHNPNATQTCGCGQSFSLDSP
ncbi:iron-sulfur cluster assembly accessory protein [Roseofilum sp. BLCC_M91]|uniref:Iron-sulfur cluster assembly accessory protein n=1 Tax=Roseofilum halophilum BLCC-M91 TaxID=3022259 RepID=A0ABT7BIV3_9CYAN|nr:iron-sulfur cluster assembly accessory protein [Roseofilum halophilum]MDJ1178519.1 iron-sulfur cluster assembly accessory protein [Roseofilum halophilum BLCC-M91]